jgi:putative N6-adenine-specific DNA methylase/tRNA (guanine6-N2)-methyltransferase
MGYPLLTVCVLGMFVRIFVSVSLDSISNLAYAMIRLANLVPGDTLLDPFCGSGTLVLEALQIFKGQLSCVGMDVSKKSTDGARQNANAEGFGPDVGSSEDHSDDDHSCCRFVCSDARGLRRHVADESVDAIVTNLPWGIMTGQNQSVKDLQTLYEVFLRNSWYVLKPGGRIVMLVLRGLQVMRIVRKLSGRYRLLQANVVKTTNNLPTIVVIEKLEKDEVRDTIKGQLAHLIQFVSVSPELYQSIHNEDVDDE